MGIPAWEAERFLADTVASVRSQTYPDLRILVSIDPSSDGTVELCERLAGEDERVELVVHEERLGWVGNMNAIIERVESELFVLLPHDDRLDPRYLERLVPSAMEDDVIVAYGDISLEMPKPKHFFADLPDGAPAARMATFLAGTPNGIALRGVTRTAPLLDRGIRLRDNRFDGFLAGTTYVLELLATGKAVRVPETLYTKWVREDSVHESRWKAWPRERLMRAWIEHTISCLDVVASADLNPADRSVASAIAIHRLERQALPGGALFEPGSEAIRRQLEIWRELVHRLGRAPQDGAEESSLVGIMDVSQAQTRYLQAISLRDSNQLQDACVFLSEAIALDPGFAEAHLQRAAILFDRGLFAAGLADSAVAQDLLPDDPRTHLMTSRLLAAFGDMGAARRAAEAAHELDPDHPNLQQHMTWLAAQR